MTEQTLIEQLAVEIYKIARSDVDTDHPQGITPIVAKLEAAFREVIGTIEPVSDIRLTAEVAEVLGKVVASSEGRNKLKKLQALKAGITLTEEKK